MMQNTARLRNKSNRLYSFDLKGSTVGRSSKINLVGAVQNLSTLLQTSLADDNLDGMRREFSRSRLNSTNSDLAAPVKLPIYKGELKDLDFISINKALANNKIEKRVVSVNQNFVEKLN